MSSFDDRTHLNFSRARPEEVDAYLARAHRLRSQAFGKGLRALFRFLLKPRQRAPESGRVKTGGALHST